jgi:hypothetical protein
VSARLRYLALTAGRTRAALPPLAASLFLVIGVYAYRDNDPGSSFAVTALMACGLAAWAVGAVLAGEPDAQSDMATTALGGRGARAGLEIMLVVAVATGLTVVFLAYPLGLVAVGVANEFDPAVKAGDVVAGALGHLSCAALGGAIGVLFAPPRLTRRATAIASVIAALLALVAMSAAFGPVGGPVAFAQAETDAAAGTVSGAVLVASASCLVLAGALVAGATRWAARSG